MIGFWTGYALGVITGPLAIYLIPFHFSSRDHAAEVSLRDHRTIDEQVEDAARRERSQIVGPF